MVLGIQRLWTTAATLISYSQLQTTPPQVGSFLLSSYKEWPKSFIHILLAQVFQATYHGEKQERKVWIFNFTFIIIFFLPFVLYIMRYLHHYYYHGIPWIWFSPYCCWCSIQSITAHFPVLGIVLKLILFWRHYVEDWRKRSNIDQFISFVLLIETPEWKCPLERLKLQKQILGQETLSLFLRKKYVGHWSKIMLTTL